MRLLLLEDDVELQGIVERRLRASGFAVDTTTVLDEARQALAVNDYDCVVLDRSVPGGDALRLVEELRAEGDAVPALFLTAKDAVRDRVEGFEAGGNDYLVKPFAMAELVARVRNLCRIAAEAAPAVLRVGDLEFDQARAAVRRSGVLLPLTPKELCLLAQLARRPGTVVSRSELTESCWDELTDPLSNTVDVHVASLRRKLGSPPLISTVRGAGYLLEGRGDSA